MNNILTRLALVAALVPTSSGKTIERGNLVLLRFPEPVVQRSELLKKSDKFDVTGDSTHQPECLWLDQDCLQVTFAPGTSVFTSFQLTFKPGQDKYLAGGNMEKATYRFSCPRSGLRIAPVAGTPTATFCVTPENRHSKEAQEFSADTAVQYSFRYCREEKDGSFSFGESLPGKAEPAKLGMIPAEYLNRALQVLKEQKPDWSQVNGETPVPGFVMVRAPELPNTGDQWEFRATPAEESGLRESDKSAHLFTPEAEPGTDVTQHIFPLSADAEQSGRMYLSISFSCPVKKSAIESIFRSLTIRAGGQTATDNGDTKTLSLNGKEVSFKLLPPKTDKVARFHGIPKDDNGIELLSFSPEDTVNALNVEFSAMDPTELDIIIPAGTTTANGLSTICDHHHRISIHPAAPQLGLGMPHLPLRGDHVFRLPAHNVESLQMQVWHMNAEQFQKEGSIMSDLTKQTEHASWLEKLRYLLALEEKKNNTDKENTLKRLRKNILQAERELVASRLVSLPFLSRLTAFEPHTISLQKVDSNELLYSRELCVNLDTLTGGNTKPGYYIVKVQAKVTPAVRRVLESLGLKSDLFEQARYFPIHVTDLLASADEGLLILTRLSDGSLVSEGELVTKNGERLPIHNGICHTGEWDKNCIVCAGDDYTTATTDSSYFSPSQKLQAETFADRPLYRPGDTVHLRGVLRRVSPTSECSIADGVKVLHLKVTRPNGDILFRRDITPDEYGSWAHSFPLPNGEEDVTGNYRVELNAPGERLDDNRLILPCQVFRRDTFAAEITMEAASIRPDTFNISVQATDLNGTPLSNAEAELTLSCSAPMLSRTAGEKPAKSLNFRVKTDAQGNAGISGIITQDFPLHLNGQAWLSVQGSVVNDRQEYLQLPDVNQRVYAADFTASLHRSALCLYAADTQTKLGREQTVHVRVCADTIQEKTLPGGICIAWSQETCLLEQDITVPANCESGIPLPLAELFERANNSRQLKVLVSGTDSAGRKLETRLRYYTWEAREEQDDATTRAQDITRITAKPTQQGLLLQLQTHRAGDALLVLQSLKGIRAIPIRVQGKPETQHLPLQEGESGHLACQLLQPTEGKNKLFTEWVSTDDSCIIPRPEAQVSVSLTTPGQAVLPGSETELSGRVTLPDGSAADAAVTLFAVDKGMLSVSPYELPMFSSVFTHKRWQRLYLRGNDRNWNTRQESLSPVLLGPLHDGRIIGTGRWFRIYQNHYRARPTDSFAAGVLHKAATTGEEDYEEDIAMNMGMDLSDEGAESAQAAPSAMAETRDVPKPRLRTDFAPVAVWQAALRTDENGYFSSRVKLPDTLTTYRVFAVAVSRCGKRFGQAEGEFTVNQPVMLTPGTPLFMSVGDRLRLPLTITNNTEKDDTWQVSLEGAGAPQSIMLKAGTTGTLFFDFSAAAEGENTLRWTATAAAGGDAVEGSFPVRFPAPVLKETHHLVQAAGAEELKLATLPAAELASSTRNTVQLELSANPLLHLASAMDFVLSYPYGCTEQTASGLLPWIFHSRLAPFSPTMQSVSPQEVSQVITRTIEKLFKRQQADGGLGYWSDSRESCLWASAHAALVFTLAAENGTPLPEEQMQKLRQYLSTRSEDEWKKLSVYSRYAIGRACGNEEIIATVLRDALAGTPQHGAEWWQTRAEPDIRFIAALRQKPTERHTDFLNWMRSRGRDYRHMTTWQSGWMLVALGEYLRLEPAETGSTTVQLQDGTQITLSKGITRYTPPATAKLCELPTVITTTQGTAYLNVNFRALPEKTEYPGVTEKGLQVTRVYEKKDEEGNWKPATDFRVGDVVRVTLTCAKAAPDLEYFVLEDYLPACMEAINPNVPSQAAGIELEWRPWSRWFDHKEYLADRVRGFCTRWYGRELLNMSYYARVKRAGIATAPPAQAQLMYEPQVYGLSPNTIICSK